MALKIGSPAGFTSLVKDGTRHLEEAVYRNITACNDISTITRTSLGPHGLNKLIVNQLEKLFVTSDAATIMRELEVNHPAAKLLVMASQQQEQEAGDGTNLVLVLAGALLSRAEDLLKLGMHPSEIVEGYERAWDLASTMLDGCVVRTVATMTAEALTPPVATAIGTKQRGLETLLADLVVQAALTVMPSNPRTFAVDSVRVVKVLGGSLVDSRVVAGMVLGREAESTLKAAVSAKVAVFACPLDIGRTETKGTVLLHDAQQLLDFSKGEEALLEQQFRDIAATGAKVLVTGGSIGELALHYINRLGLVAVKVLSKFDLQRLCRVVGATALARLGPPTAEELGFVDVVEALEIGSDRCTVFRQEREATRTASIVLRGSTLSYLEDVERAIDDGVNTIKTLTRDGRLVPGAGATEMHLAEQLQAAADRTPGLGQYGIKKFAEALEAVPRALAENAGLDAEQVLARLYAAQQQGRRAMGVDGDGDLCVQDALEAGLVDSYAVKRSAMFLAVDAALNVLRVDSIIMSKPAGGPKARKMGAHDADDD